MIIILAGKRTAGGYDDLMTQPGLGTPADQGGSLDQAPLLIKHKKRKKRNGRQRTDQGTECQPLHGRSPEQGSQD